MLDSLRWRRVRLPGTAVPVWRLWPDAAGPASLELMLASAQEISDWATAQALVLSADEHARAARFATASLVRRWLTAHVLLRWAIAAHVHASPGELTFARTDTGKPVLSGRFAGSATFSLAHSGEWIVIAVAPGMRCEIGVDAEMLVTPATAAELSSAFTSAERAELSRLKGSAFARAATRLWTRKEAYLKALGTGLLRDPSLDCIGAGQVPRTPSDAPAGTVIADLPTLPGNDAHAALCTIRHPNTTPTQTYA